jgi:hypothetical protein
MDDYKFTTTIRNKEVKYRKWKVKDKKKIIQSVDDKKLIKDALVYDCIKEDIALSEEEYKFMLYKIRNISLKDKIDYVFECQNCSEIFDYSADLDEIMSSSFEEYGEIISGNTFISIDSIRNKNFYEDQILDLNESDKQFIDFLLHIKSINDNTGFTFEELKNEFNNMNIDIFEDIFKQWQDLKFKVNNIGTVKCPKCSDEIQMEFDLLPNFFPDSWNI